MTVNDAITPDRLLALGFLPNADADPSELCVRIVGGSDDGWKKDSNADDPNDEIANLVLSPVEDSETGAWGCYVETWHATTLNTVSLVELGTRTTVAEVVGLCRALKAWAVRYPDGGSRGQS